MSAARSARVKELFLAACERRGQQRAGFLEEACGGDRALRREVEELLAHHDADSWDGDPVGAGLPQGDRFAPGEVFAGRYRIVSGLGRGGMGEVYRAEDLTLGVPVALKFLRAQGSRHRERLLNEVRLTREVSHPGVCRVFDVGEADGETFFTMEYIEGEDLASQLRRIGPLPAAKVLELAGELCASLAAAHERGVLHRDLKPANIMVDAEGHARILDFGIAVREGVPDRIPVGTPAYMAPEQLEPGGEATEQADLYALGLVLYELLSGRPLFAATTLAERRELHRSAPRRPSAWAAEVDPRLAGMILRALREDPRDRPSSARALAQMLEEAPSDAGTAAAAPTAGERRQLTVMCCEFELAARGPGDLDPDELGEVVRRGRQRVARVVERYEGRVAQELGDGVLCYFGYPRAYEDDALRAVRAALGVVEALSSPAAGREARAPRRPPAAVQVAVGIDTGPVVLGEAEEGAQSAPLAVGDAVNVAIHLLRGAEPGAVVISERTRRLVEGAFVLEERGGKSLPSAAGAGRVYRVVRATGAERRLTGSTPAGPTPLIGREPELALLRDRWEQAADGRGQVVLVSGEPGIGKSRLIRAFRDSLSDPRPPWLECRGSAFDTHSPFHPVIELAGHMLRFRDAPSPEEKLERLERGLALVGLEATETVPLLASLLSLPLPERYAPLEISPQLLRQRTLETLCACVLGLAERQPLVLVVEDLHWIDPTTREWLGMLVEQAPTAALLVVLATRPEVEGAWASRAHLLQLTLSPLTPRQITAMVEAIASGMRIPAPLLDQVVKRTDGVPLFVEELTKSVLEAGGFRESQGASRPERPTELAIPATLQGSLMARVDRLGAAKPVAQLGAVLGREFRYELLAAVSPMDGARLEAALTRLVEAELLYPRGLPPKATYIFKHALIRDTAYQSLLKKTRQEHHERTARTLEERFPERVASRPEVVAHHYAEAGRTVQAIGHYQRAGERASRTWANEEAVGHLRRAIELLGTLPETRERDQQELGLQMAIAGPLMAARGFAHPEYEGAYDRARALASRIGEMPSGVLVGLAISIAMKGDLATSSELASRALEAAERRGGAVELLLAHYAVGVSLYSQGEFSPSLHHMEQGIGLYDFKEHAPLFAHRVGVDLGVTSRAYASFCQVVLGYPDRGLATSEEAVALARRVEHPLSLATALTYSAFHHLVGWEPGLIQARADEAMTLAEKLGFPLLLTSARLVRGWARAVVQRDDEAVAEIQQGMAEQERLGQRVAAPSYLAMLAEAFWKLGRHDDALGTLRLGVARAQETGAHYQDAELDRLQAEILLDQDGGRPDDAESLLRRALEIAREQEARWFELRAATSLARLFRDQGRSDEARALLQPVYDWFTEGFDTADLKEAKALLEELA